MQQVIEGQQIEENFRYQVFAIVAVDILFQGLTHKFCKTSIICFTFTIYLSVKVDA